MRHFNKILLILIVLLLLLSSQFIRALDEQSNTATAANPTESGQEISADLETGVGSRLYSEQWTGDLDEMESQRMIRVLTVYGLGRYYLDGGREKGLTYELFKAFENHINDRLGRKHVRVHVVFIPVSRDELLPRLISGRGDIAAAGLTITPEREELIDFTNPLTKDISEVLVTGPSAPQIATIDDLSGETVHVRASSSYRSSLDRLNRQFREEGKPEIILEDASENLEDADLLEMVNSGLLDWAVVDSYKASTWAGVFDKLTVRNDIVFRTGARIGVAVREDSPKLLAELNEFMKSNRQGTLHGNILINRYLKNFDWAKNALSSKDFRRFQNVADIFEKYGEQYGVDYLMVAAQGYQESGLDQDARSGAGAVGIMQLLPSTAADKNVGIPDISDEDSNIHAGVKYLDFIRDRYFSDPEIDRFNQTLFAFAAYNAGPARVAKLRSKAEQQGYDPNIWFDNVEIIAAKEIGRETVQYVANILKYYVAYRLSVEQELKREEARKKQHIG
ncbi:MAG: lytic transglycosylase F [Xanthomonadales bacterium]|nr:lytic transglycosylase F [Gammaproteobacteria bacterium]MBT8051569.1 lytic transglycosylase F [Gammaproteobacteria bacterium]MBT8074155.1 lytic transglycosylase F [Gammaproteobacteria bacterium]NNK05008.1 lytic transglycosylase F [Xanthomonadales bacterium]NNK52179.1 lytic transglycosylase F [Xanthomonadales bacterium]